MLNSAFTARVVVPVEILLAAAYVAVDVPTGGEFGRTAFPWMLGLVLLFGALSFWAALRRHPAALVLRPGVAAFDAPPSPLPVLAFTALMPMTTEKLSTTIDRVANRVDPWWLDILSTTVWIGFLTVLAVAAWRGFGVRLRPDGILDRRPVRPVFMPWQSLGPGRPVVAGRFQVLVGRRGLSTWNIDSTFLARVIQEYADHPEHRPAIGTEAELRRLLD
ncbi:hypothetical protein [Actinoplanes lobatus]|uniref:PH domain-containing protein n=1 Tax=Actinoplanes lobatus TaxID=113568 RepID=A0A7W7MIH6_9ACTN|nr:hypothetical protein [Actinoplanes lobatus]MBB4751489.1 hypothetical protein [Actinoplanes lobatus]